MSQATSPDSPAKTAAPASSSASPSASPSVSQPALNPWWLLLGLPLGGTALLYWKRQRSRVAAALPNSLPEDLPDSLPDSPTAEPEPKAEPELAVSTASSSAAVTVTHTAARLAKIDIVEALVNDLQSPDIAQRRKAIWELGQSGDSRAVQPLVDLLMDADSQQRSLILGAVSEINARSLKPMNRALMLALQDQSPDVRRNAIRDVTRIYELMTQVSQLLQYAASDSDHEVQETAHWALSQLNRMQSAPQTTSASLPELSRPEPPALDSAE